MLPQEPIKLACLFGCFSIPVQLSLDLKHHVATILWQLYTYFVTMIGFCFHDSSLLLAVWTFVVILIKSILIPGKSWSTLYTSKFGRAFLSVCLYCRCQYFPVISKLWVFFIIRLWLIIFMDVLQYFRYDEWEVWNLFMCFLFLAKVIHLEACKIFHDSEIE